jgi:DeoR family transcriptional regulator of aga operon
MGRRARTTGVESPERAHRKRPGTPVSAVVRRDLMLAVINELEFVSVEELSERFGISGVTVRSDLNQLASRLQIYRIRGGAVARSATGQERPFEETLRSFALEKLAIGQAAAQLIHNGETVLLDVGTTAVATARALARRTDVRDVAVFTNGVKTALELEPAIPRLNVILLGGTLRPLQHSLVDPFASAILAQINVNTVFLGCNGVHAEVGVTNVNLPEAEVKKRMLRAAHRRIVLADGSKIGRIELANLCAIDEIDMVITGESADRVAVQALVDRGCDVRLVG